MTIVKLYELILNATVKALKKASEKASKRSTQALKKAAEVNTKAAAETKVLFDESTEAAIEATRLKTRAEKLAAAL